MRKKSSRQSKESRTSAILEAARRVFERDGYEKAKMADIAADVGVVEGTVFHYFSSKQLLVLKVMEAFYVDITAGVATGLREVAGTTQQRLHFLIHYHLTVMRDNAALCGVILNASRDIDAELAQDIRLLNRNYTHALVEVIRDGVASGELKADTSAQLIRNTVYGSIEHAMWVQLADRQAIDVAINARQLSELVYRGVRTENPRAVSGEVAELVGKLNNMIGH